MVVQKKTPTTLMLLTAVAAAVVVASAIGAGAVGIAHAQGTSGMSVTATAQDGSDTIMITGKTASTQNAVIVHVKAPNDNIVSVSQIIPDADGAFDTRVVIGGSLWKQDGIYTITAKQGKSSLYDLSLRIRIGDGAAFETDVTQSTFVDAADMQQPDTVPRTRGLTIEADAMEGADMFTINGDTTRTQVPITLRVTAPNGNIVSVNQISPNADGSFSREIIIGGNLWSEDGDYTVTAQQGEGSNYKSSVQVEIKDGLVIPEFGAVAVLVLAVAIVAIIAASARSRLSIVMPKY